jgi:uncharacterized membrane protein YbhN (UPF0104 family)
VLGTLALVAAWLADLVPFESNVLLVGPATVVVTTLAMILLASDRFFNASFVRGLLSRAPRRLRNFVSALHDYLKAPRLVTTVVAISVINHTLVVWTFIIAAVLIRDTLPIYMHFVVNPLAFLLNAVPLTPGGLGLAESAFSFLYEMAGSPNGAIVGLLGRLILYGVFVISGAVAFLMLKPGGHIVTVDQPPARATASEAIES